MNKFNKRELASILDVSERTLTECQVKGLPIASVAAKIGEANEYELQAVARWLATSLKAREGMGAADDGGETFSNARVRKERAAADLLEHVRDAREALRLVHAPDLVPDLRYHDRRTVVFLDDDAHAVGQRRVVNIAAAADEQAGNEHEWRKHASVKVEKHGDPFYNGPPRITDRSARE